MKNMMSKSILMSVSLVGFSLLSLLPSISQARELACQSAGTWVQFSVSGNQLGSVKAVSSSDENLHAAGLSVQNVRETVTEYSFALKALGDNCTLVLPNNLTNLESFEAHLKCFDGNGLMVNDVPAQGSAGNFHGEAMNCRLSEF